MRPRSCSSLIGGVSCVMRRRAFISGDRPALDAVMERSELTIRSSEALAARASRLASLSASSKPFRT